MNHTTLFRLPPSLRLGSFRDVIGFEVSPVCNRSGGSVEVVEGSQEAPDFWTLYETDSECLAQAIADFPDEAAALAGAVKLGGVTTEPAEDCACEGCAGAGEVAPGFEGAPMETCPRCWGSGFEPLTSCGCPAFDYVETVFTREEIELADSRCETCGWPVFYDSGKGGRHAGSV